MATEDVFRSGKILSKVLSKTLKFVDSSVPLVEIAEKIEGEIYKLGGKPAFPCNIGIDNVAAHYTPKFMDKGVLEGKVVKIDVGVHINGWIADAAYTLALSKEGEKISRAAKEALEEAIAFVKPGREVREIGEKIENVAKKYGVKTIKNLGGHEIKQYSLHGGLFIPNIRAGRGVIEEGMIIAIEPFTTNGRGYVNDGPYTYIFSVEHFRARSPGARALLSKLYDSYDSLPFAQRWVEKEFGKKELINMMELVKTGCLKGYPVLLEEEKALVAQWENTVYIDKDGGVPVVELPETI